MIVRCTSKARALLGAVDLANVPAGPDDWYLNLLWFGGRKCLLLVHASTVFPVLVPDVRKTDLASLGLWVAAVARDALRAEGLSDDALGEFSGGDVTIAKTASRHILGFMNEMAMHADYAIDDAGGVAGCDVAALNHQLRRTLHNHNGHYATALDLVADRRNRRTSASQSAALRPPDLRPATARSD